MARRLKDGLRAPVICALQGEDCFLDALPEPHRAACWRELADRARDVDLFIAPSRYFGDLMRERLGLAATQVRVVPNGINLEGYGGGARTTGPQTTDHRPRSTVLGPQSSLGGGEGAVLGYFARMCPEKGLDTLVEAYIRLRQRGRAGRVRLRVGGSCGPGDTPFVNSLRERLQAGGLLGDADFNPNLDRAGKLALLRSLSVFSVPARYGEAFGLYVIEALAAGVPVVQPRVAAFPELIEATAGGVLCAPDDPEALAEAIEGLLLDPARARALGEAGQRAVFERFNARAMARAVAEACGFFSSTRLLSPALSSILNGGEGEEARRMHACCIHTCHRIQYPHAPRAAHLLPLRHWRSACWGLPSKTATLSRSHAPRSPAPRERSGGRGRLVQLFADGLGQFLQVEGFREEGRPFAQGDILASNLRTIAAHINNL